MASASSDLARERLRLRARGRRRRRIGLTFLSFLWALRDVRCALLVIDHLGFALQSSFSWGGSPRGQRNGRARGEKSGDGALAGRGLNVGGVGTPVSRPVRAARGSRSRVRWFAVVWQVASHQVRCSGEDFRAPSEFPASGHPARSKPVLLGTRRFDSPGGEKISNWWSGNPQPLEIKVAFRTLPRSKS